MDLQNRIIRYLETTKEASVYEIQANIDFREINPIEKLKAILSIMIKEGTIKKGKPGYYRIRKEIKNNQIKMF